MYGGGLELVLVFLLAAVIAVPVFRRLGLGVVLGYLAAGVPATVQRYDGVTHEFFGLGAVVDKARQAQPLAGEKLRAAFADSKTTPVAEPVGLR